jgi:teichuronic acid biosynthesis glycosyltransferase TuaC
MRVSVLTKIFPSSLEPLSAPFNRQQIGELGRRCDVDVLVAIPHVPLASVLRVPERAARLAALPARERVDGLDVTYVRQLYVPRVGAPIAVPLYLGSLLPYLNRLQAADVVLATWAYPDGCAGVLAAHALDKPCVVKVHGSDVNVVLKRRTARSVAARVLPKADAVVAVSQSLADELVRLGVPAAQVAVVTNGVDASVFFPRCRTEARRALGVADGARVILFVGRLEPQKGVRELLGAFERVRRRIPSATLVLLGDGVSCGEVRARVGQWGNGVARVLGPKTHREVAEWMGATDVLTLPSWAEGMPNVVWEALASGRPVVATSVGGIAHALRSPQAGIVVPPKNEEALADALCAALDRTWDERALRAYGPPSWKESAAMLYDVLLEAAAKDRRGQRRWKRSRNERLAIL